MNIRIPWYVPVWVEELVRAAVTAVGAYLVISVQANGVPTTQQALFSLLAGAVPIAYAAIRAALNKTPATPDGPNVVLPPTP